MTQLFPQGVKGLADSKWSGVLGSAYRLVGLDLHSKPGLIKVAQAMAKDSSTTITELCKVAVSVSDGSKLWFSSESGKIWREASGTYTLIHTTDTDPDVLSDTFSWTFSAEVEAYSIGTLIMPSGSAYPQLAYSAANGSTGSATTLTTSVTVPAGTNRVLVVIFSNIEASADEMSGATYNGNAMTAGSSGTTNIEGVTTRFAIFYTVDPTATTANIVGTWAGATTNRMMHAFVFTGAHQTTPLSGLQTAVNNTDATSHSLDVPSSADYQTRLSYVITEAATHTQANSQTLAQASASGSSYNYSSSIVNDVDMGSAINLSAEEHGDYIFWTTDKLLFRVLVADIASTWSITNNYGYFANGDDTYHPMAKQNNELFIGDDIVIAKVGSVVDSYLFTAETDFNIQAPERITSIAPFDNDVIVGTLVAAKGRALRWDTTSDSWSAEDETPGGGVFAFIRDDNYLYAVIGNFGKLMFYNGEKLEAFLTIPGDYSPTKKLKINPHAVGFLLGVPVFGVSNSTGNPALEGIYSLGSYSKDYPKILDLTYPISSGEFTGMEIGAILVDGADLYASWKGSASQGVDKLNWSAKYTAAYIESVQLIDLVNRGFLKTLKEFRANYASLPSGTDITLKYDKNYTGSYTTIASVKDTNILQKRSNKSVPEIGALQLRADFTVSSNDAPEVEGFEYFMANQKSKP